MPTLVMVGRQDRVVLPSTARSFVAIPGARRVEHDDAGQIFVPAQAERWARDVSALLGGPSSR